MSFLTLNGLSIDVRDGSFKSDPDDVLFERRAEDGSWVRSETARRREWNFETVPLTPTSAAALYGHLSGDGHTWTFDSTKYSSKVLGPNAAGTHSLSTSQKKFGAKSLLVGSASSVVFAVGTSFSSTWTISVWKYEGSGWLHYAKTSAGTQYKSGSVHTSSGGDSVTNWASGGSSVTLSGKDIGGTNSASAYYDQLVVVPYVMTAAQVAGEAAATAAFAGRPRLTAVVGETSGATISTTVVPRVTSEQYIQCNVGGTFFTDARVLSVRLKET